MDALFNSLSNEGDSDDEDDSGMVMEEAGLDVGNEVKGCLVDKEAPIKSDVVQAVASKL